MVNADDPDVVEIWNIVFVEYTKGAAGGGGGGGGGKGGGGRGKKKREELYPPDP